jgi:hypothetical protein
MNAAEVPGIESVLVGGWNNGLIHLSRICESLFFGRISSSSIKISSDAGIGIPDPVCLQGQYGSVSNNGSERVIFSELKENGDKGDGL